MGYTDWCIFFYMPGHLFVRICFSKFTLVSAQILHNVESEVKQAISAGERALCQLTVCFELLSRSERRK